MDIKQLGYFLQVARAGSYSQAAQQLSITQPTLSICIKKLEEELGVELFFTSGRRQQLTDEGERLMAGANELMELHRKVLEQVRHTGENTPGHITLGLPPLIGSCFFNTLIPAFSRAYPNVGISIVEEGARKIERMTAAGELDVACTIEPAPNDTLETRLLTRRANVVVVHKDHPLAKRPSLTIADLQGQPLSVFNEDFVLHHQIMAAFRSAGIAPSIFLLSSQWDFIVEMVQQRQSVAILPRPILDKHPTPGVALVPLADGMRNWDIFLLWNRQRYLSTACRSFLRFTLGRFPPPEG